MVKTVAQIERNLKIIKPLKVKSRKDSDVIAEWELADKSRIEKILDKVDGKKKFYYLRWVYGGGSRDYSAEWGEGEEFNSWLEVKKFAIKIRHETAMEIKYNDKMAKDAGLDRGKEIYDNIKKKYPRKDWKNQLKKNIKEWGSYSAHKEYGTYAEGITSKLKKYYRGLS